jgi:hypothetical protein
MVSNPEQFNRCSLGVKPSPLKLARALMRPAEPFVMINLLAFKDQASGDYAHLTGEEAYGVYVQSMQSVQASLGSRLLWAGRVRQKLMEGSRPTFHSIALLEYASPKAFLEFALKGGSNTNARAAGLSGQWLIASTTLEISTIPDSSEAPVVLVEMIGGVKRNPLAGRIWQEIRETTHTVVGTKTLWYGRCDQHVIGTAIPGIEEVLVTWFPDAKPWPQLMSDPERKDRLAKLQPYLAYTAQTMVEPLPRLR